MGDHHKVELQLVCRPPYYPAGFLLEMADLLSDVMLWPTKLVVLEDFSIHAEAIQDRSAQKFLTGMITLDMSQVISGPHIRVGILWTG